MKTQINKMETVKEIKFFTKKHETEVIEEIKEALRMCFKNDIVDLYHENKYFGFDISINIKGEWLTIFFLSSHDGEYRGTIEGGTSNQTYKIINLLIPA